MIISLGVLEETALRQELAIISKDLGDNSTVNRFLFLCYFQFFNLCSSCKDRYFKQLFLMPYSDFFFPLTFFYPEILSRNLALNQRFLSFPPKSIFRDLPGRQRGVGYPLLVGLGNTMNQKNQVLPFHSTDSQMGNSRRCCLFCFNSLLFSVVIREILIYNKKEEKTRVSLLKVDGEGTNLHNLGLLVKQVYPQSPETHPRSPKSSTSRMLFHLLL